MKIKAKYSIVAYQEVNRDYPTLVSLSKCFRNKEDALKYAGELQQSIKESGVNIPQGKWAIIDLETILD